MSADLIAEEHRAALASITPAQRRALAREHEARVRRWKQGGHERDHLGDLFAEEARRSASAGQLA